MFFLEVKYAFSFKMRYRIVLYIYQNTWISFFIFVGRYPFSDSSIDIVSEFGIFTGYLLLGSMCWGYSVL